MSDIAGDRGRGLDRVRDLPGRPGLDRSPAAARGATACSTTARRPSPRPAGPVLVFYNTDNRMHREVERGPRAQAEDTSPSQGTPPGVVDNDLFVAALTAPATAGRGEPRRPAGAVARRGAGRAPSTPSEAADVARMRAYRIEAGRQDLSAAPRRVPPPHRDLLRRRQRRRARGHVAVRARRRRASTGSATATTTTAAARNTPGGSIQKTTDLYHNPPAFMPMFTYERSVQLSRRASQRDVPLPRASAPCRGWSTRRGQDRRQRQGRGRQDALRLPERAGRHLRLAHLGAPAWGPTGATNDPKVEPIVEIYQGARESYEHLGAPRVAHGPGERGRRLEADGHGLERAGDAVPARLPVLERPRLDAHQLRRRARRGPSRAAIFDAFKKRHCYAATDNIVLDVRSGEHLMGDEFDADGPVTLKVIAHGTGPITAGRYHQGLRLRLLDRAEAGPRRLHLDRRGAARPAA